ncbi:unnamed protein product [Closterium sp. NIES-65]|nr:unnamed protein product [Closterium sp. NIES-65]
MTEARYANAPSSHTLPPPIPSSSLSRSVSSTRHLHYQVLAAAWPAYAESWRGKFNRGTAPPRILAAAWEAYAESWRAEFNRGKAAPRPEEGDGEAHVGVEEIGEEERRRREAGGGDSGSNGTLVEELDHSPPHPLFPPARQAERARRGRGLSCHGCSSGTWSEWQPMLTPSSSLCSATPAQDTLSAAAAAAAANPASHPATATLCPPTAPPPPASYASASAAPSVIMPPSTTSDTAAHSEHVAAAAVPHSLSYEPPEAAPPEEAPGEKAAEELGKGTRSNL